MRKLVAYLNSLLNFPLKNIYFYQGIMPISTVITVLAFVSICVCNAQCKLEIPIVLHGKWKIGTLISRNLHSWLNSLNWNYRKINKWYTNETVTPPPFCMSQLMTSDLLVYSVLTILGYWDKFFYLFFFHWFCSISTHISSKFLATLRLIIIMFRLLDKNNHKLLLNLCTKFETLVAPSKLFFQNCWNFTWCILSLK